MQKTEILKDLQTQIRVNGTIIGTVAGSGMTAKYTALGGADLILALSAGKLRLMGRSSYASYLCYLNSNEMVMDLGTRELLPILPDKPIIFGLNAGDPSITLYEYIQKIKQNGFSGIVNFPTVCLIDGKFREALEEDGNSFDLEVEAIRIANFLELFTIAFVHTEDQTRRMAEAGADVICVHFGLTKGGYLGAKKYLSLERAKQIANRLFKTCDEVNPEIIKMVYGGPAHTPLEVRYISEGTACMGYIGGSTFDRIPTEEAILNTTKSFKYAKYDGEDVRKNLFNGAWNENDAIRFVTLYIQENYMQSDLLLSDLAQVVHLSPSYLSTRFKQATGCNFRDYLINIRMEKAKEIILNEEISLKSVSSRVGYEDYVQFSKMFKKYTGLSPMEFEKSNKNTSITSNF